MLTMNLLCPFREDMFVDELGHAPLRKAMSHC